MGAHYCMMKHVFYMLYSKKMFISLLNQFIIHQVMNSIKIYIIAAHKKYMFV